MVSRVCQAVQGPWSTWLAAGTVRTMRWPRGQAYVLEAERASVRFGTRIELGERAGWWTGSGIQECDGNQSSGRHPILGLSSVYPVGSQTVAGIPTHHTLELKFGSVGDHPHHLQTSPANRQAQIVCIPGKNYLSTISFRPPVNPNIGQRRSVLGETGKRLFHFFTFSPNNVSLKWPHRAMQ